VFVLGISLQSSLKFASKAGAYPSEASFIQELHFLGRLLALHRNLKLGLDGLSGANTLAYSKIC
jgi:hypothetical protein